MLQVVINDRALSRTLTGVGNYIAQLLLHLPTFAPDVRADPFWYTYVSRRHWRERLAPPGAPPPAPPTAAAQSPKDLGDSRYPWWLRRLLQGGYRAYFRMRTSGYALYHEPNHIPMRCRLPTVTTIHDLSVIMHPEWHPADRVRWYEREFDAGVRQTSAFIAASQFTRREMLSRLRVPPERVFVTYQAARAAFQPASPATIAATRAALDLPVRFFLYVGTLEPRKNVEGLLDSYAALPARLRREHPLLIAGAWGWKADALRAKLNARELGRDVRLLGYLHDPELATLYSACTALVWPTWYEGLGLPPLEAMACGAPVIVSNVASLPEVVGNAGALLDPRDPPAWTDAMRRTAEDDDYRAAARSAGIAQAARFTWERFIQGTLDAYRCALTP